MKNSGKVKQTTTNESASATLTRNKPNSKLWVRQEMPQLPEHLPLIRAISKPHKPNTYLRGSFNRNIVFSPLNGAGVMLQTGTLTLAAGKHIRLMGLMFSGTTFGIRRYGFILNFRRSSGFRLNCKWIWNYSNGQHYYRYNTERNKSGINTGGGREPSELTAQEIL